MKPFGSVGSLADDYSVRLGNVLLLCMPLSNLSAC